jgi:hypothetical protein
VELHIEPEPTPEERAAIVAALEETAALGADPRSGWGRPELADELSTQPDGA